MGNQTKKGNNFYVMDQSWTRYPIYLDKLIEACPFSTWIRTTISLAIKDGGTIDKDIVHMFMLHTLEATTYWPMYAFGNYICVSSVEEHFITINNNVTTTFEHECVSKP